jgi:hypothetical protein
MPISRGWSTLFTVRFFFRFSTFLHFHSFAPFLSLLVALAEAFPSSTKDVVAAVEECRAEYHIICHENPKAELSSEELMASMKGRLKPAAKLGNELRQAIASIF